MIRRRNTFITYADISSFVSISGVIIRRVAPGFYDERQYLFAVFIVRREDEVWIRRNAFFDFFTDELRVRLRIGQPDKAVPA